MESLNQWRAAVQVSVVGGAGQTSMAVVEAVAAVVVRGRWPAMYWYNARIYLFSFSLATGALRRKCRCFEASEMSLTSHRPGAGAL